MDADRQRVLVEGLIAGLVGFLTVALLFAAVNVLGGQSPFRTAALLGEALFYDLEDPAAVTISAGPILAYNGLHLVVFLVLGMGAALLFLETERHPLLVYPIFFFAMAVFIYGWILVVVVSEPIAGAFPRWLVGAANLAAAVTMGGYLWRAHPKLREEMREYEEIDARAAGEE